MGSFTQNLGTTYNGSDPRRLAQSQRGYLQNYADWMNSQAQQQAGYSGGQMDYYEQLMNNSFGPMAAGAGGYNPQEAGAINGLYSQNGIPGLADNFTSQDDFNSNYLTPEEEAGMRGNPNYGGYFDPASMDQAQQESAGFQRGAVGGLQQGLNGAIDPNALSQSHDYLNSANDTLAENRGNTMATLTGEAGNVRGAMGDEQGAVRGAIDPATLRQSADASSQIKMTPQQQQDIVTGAGISAGVRNQAAVGDLQRQTSAAGGSPQAVAAYRERMGRESAAEAGDAMTQARIQASNAAATRAQSAEAQRLGAEQYLTGEKTGTELAMGQQNTASELNMGQQAMQAQQALGAQKLGQQNTQEAQRLAANQYLTGAKMQAATVGGEAAIGNEQAINAQQRQQQQFNTQTGTGILQAQDQAQAARAQALAQNRQGVGMYNQQTKYGQGLTANQLASQRAAQVAGTRLGQQQFGLNAYSQLQGQKNSNTQNAFNRQQQTFSTAAGATNQATGMGLTASQTPSRWDKIIGGVMGAAGAAAGGMADGGVVTEPTLAVLGEDGPEKVTPAKPKMIGINSHEDMSDVGGDPSSDDFDYTPYSGQFAGPDKPSKWKSALGGLGGFGAGYGKGMDWSKAGGMAGKLAGHYLDDGQVVTEPTLAVLGENGPEKVEPLSYRPNAKVRPQRRPMYGEAA